MRRSVIIAAVLAGLTALPAQAQDREFNFALRGGISAGPSYPGSDDLEFGPDLTFAFGGLRWGNFSVGEGVRAIPQDGLALRGAFRFIQERDPADHPELAGLGKTDAAVELGLNLTYRKTNWLIFGEVRQGFGGHHGVVGTLGGDAIFQPNDRLTITFGPRLAFGDSEFAQTYFGVTPAQAAASSFAAFDADGGLLSAGLELGAVYTLDHNWALEGAVSYDRLRNAAADSPVTLQGSDEQLSVRVGLSRQFSLRF